MATKAKALFGVVGSVFVSARLGAFGTYKINLKTDCIEYELSSVKCSNNILFDTTSYWVDDGYLFDIGWDETVRSIRPVVLFHNGVKIKKSILGEW